MKLSNAISLCCIYAVSVRAFVGPHIHAKPSRTFLLPSLQVSNAIELSAFSLVEESSTNNDKDSSVDFPPPLNEIDRLKRAATVWTSVVPIVARYYGLSSRIKLQELVDSNPLSDEEITALWENQHEEGAAKLVEIISNLKGFYVKAAQIISSRKDLFPQPYTRALSVFTDNLDPMPVELAKAVVKNELLNDNERFEHVFAEFDDKPLGAASIAQVHRAVLTEKYGGRQVAVKIQRPSIESKLMGDIANLKALAKPFQENPNMPLDFYTIFSELEEQLPAEFDFVQEAQAMDRFYDSLSHAPDGTPRDAPLVIPRPVSGLISQRVLVMDYLKGVPLSRSQEEMEKRGVDPESPQAKLFGHKLLSALTLVFGRTILETGMFHGDPHPGNIFVLDDGQIGLIDYGQVKQISKGMQETLAKLMIALDERREDVPEDDEKISELALELGLDMSQGSKKEAAAAVAMWLFDGSVSNLPGGYDKGELSPNSAMKALKSFPKEMVLVARSSILIKGMSMRLNIPWSLAKEWAPTARQVLNNDYQSADPVGFRQHAFESLQQWGATRVVRKLPTPVRNRVARVVLKVQERNKTRRQLREKQQA